MQERGRYISVIVITYTVVYSLESCTYGGRLGVEAPAKWFEVEVSTNQTLYTLKGVLRP